MTMLHLNLRRGKAHDATSLRAVDEGLSTSHLFVLLLALAFALAASGAGAVTYSIIPLNVDGWVSGAKSMNRSGQVVGEYYDPQTGFNGAFSWTERDGVINLDAGTPSHASAVNDDGQVVGYGHDADNRRRAFSWRAGSSMVVPNMPEGSDSHAHRLNARGEVVGWATDAEGTARAFWWDPATNAVQLGTTFGFSDAFDINDAGQVVGWAAHASGQRAFSWIPGFDMIDLGPLDGSLSRANAINSGGTVVGWADDDSDTMRAFLWHGDTTIPLEAPGAWSEATALNDAGQVIGKIYEGYETYRAFVSTSPGAVHDLGTFGGRRSEAHAITDSGQVVGWASDANENERAFSWTSAGGMVDLNNVTPAKPEGLVLWQAHSVAPDGTILARSNAGLVLLRPGSLGSHPPVVSPIVATVPAAAGVAVNVSANFTDADVSDTHTAVWTWGDGSPPTPGTIEATGGSGTVNGSHVYSAAGIYRVTLTVTDSSGLSAQVGRDVVVYDPSAGFVTGGGFIQSPPGAYRPDPALSGRAIFGFVSRYQHGAKVPTGNTRFMFRAARLNFRSDAYDWLVVAGARAQFKGTGSINGTGNYSFMVTAIDGDLLGRGQPDRFRIKIWYRDAARDEDVIVYDNQIESSLEGGTSEGTAIDGGSIVIHAN
jgi:probable HAF family extracellular repeat protein